MPTSHETRLNVLVADDDPVFRSLVESRLLHLGCAMHEAADGGEAWRITRMLKLDLAFVDLEMPGLDGIALTRCLRSHPLTRHIPIIMCTSRTYGASMLAALEAGVSAFMTKPVNWSLFEGHIRHLLHASEASARCAAALEASAQGNARKDEIFERLTAAILPLLQRASQEREFATRAAEAYALMSEYKQSSAILHNLGLPDQDSTPAARSA